MPRLLPRAMRDAPALDPARETPPPRPRYALLLNPFYPKDPHGSFGKHVLTPTLALTSIAGATPPDWEVAYWDENLLQGPPPSDPFPSVVGISVHLTFARRAYALARWYRERGAKVVLGGLHVVSCPDECAPHADALALGEGVQLWPRILDDAAAGRLEPRYLGSYRRPYREDPAPRRAILPRRDFLTTSSVIATRGCHNRCGFCCLATDGLRIPYQMRDVEQIAAKVSANDEPYFVFTDNNLGSRSDYLRALCRALAPGYDRCYRRLFSSRSIWTRRPRRVGEVPGYLAMSYLYKRANLMWPWLIRLRLTHAAWRPFVAAAARRHARFRRGLAKRPAAIPGGAPVYGGV